MIATPSVISCVSRGEEDSRTDPGPRVKTSSHFPFPLSLGPDDLTLGTRGSEVPQPRVSVTESDCESLRVTGVFSSLHWISY